MVQPLNVELWLPKSLELVEGCYFDEYIDSFRLYQVFTMPI